MLDMSFATIPAVDVLDGRAVRLLRGDYDRVEVDAGDPLALVRRAASYAPPFVHVVALGAARDGGAPLELARSVVEAAGSVPVQLGGGVRSPDDVRALLDAGVARVVVGTAAFGPTPLREFVSERVAVAIDVAGGIVRTNGWLESTELTTALALDALRGSRSCDGDLHGDRPRRHAERSRPRAAARGARALRRPCARRRRDPRRGRRRCRA